MANQDDGEVPKEPTVEPNIEAIARLININGPVHRAEEEGVNSRSSLGNLYKKIQDDLHGHRGATKQVRKLLTMSATARADFMRTFEPLCEHFGLFPSQEREPDLVDTAEKGTAGAGQVASALDAAKAHLGTGTKPAAPEAADTLKASGSTDGGKAGPQPEPEVAGKKGRAKLGIVAGKDADTQH